MLSVLQPWHWKMLMMSFTLHVLLVLYMSGNFLQQLTGNGLEVQHIGSAMMSSSMPGKGTTMVHLFSHYSGTSFFCFHYLLSVSQNKK